jgi:type IV secretory pathway VirB10-like protein
MTDNAKSTESEKADPETLVLRGKPRRVTRFKRHVVIGVAAIITAAILGTSWLALRAPALKVKAGGEELYNTDTKPAPNDLASLPPSYDKVKPILGAPLPGDLGAPIVAREKNLGMSPALGSLGPKGEEDAARAEQLHLAQLARQAQEGGVFFQTAGSDHGAAAQAVADAISSLPESTALPNVGKEKPDHPPADAEHDQNGQQHKIDFANQHGDDAIYNPHTIQTLASPYEVLAGTVIPASLITGLDSDLPGFVIAQVTQNIFDSVNGTTLVIPRGSKIIGSYDSVVAFGQSRALVVWQRIIMPDGSSIQIDNLPATDTEGYSGLEDSVDYHTWALIKGVAISTLLGVGTQLAVGDQQNDLLTAIRQSTQDSVNQVGQQITQKNLNLQPTLKIRPGWPLRVIVHKDLILRPYQS